MTLIVVPGLYFASFAPVCRVMPRDKETVRTLVGIYYPLLRFVMIWESMSFERALNWYGGGTGDLVYEYAIVEHLILTKDGFGVSLDILFTPKSQARFR